MVNDVDGKHRLRADCSSREHRRPVSRTVYRGVSIPPSQKCSPERATSGEMLKPPTGRTTGAFIVDEP